MALLLESKSQSLFSTAVCKIQARKHYIESLSSVDSIDTGRLKVIGPVDYTIAF